MKPGVTGVQILDQVRRQAISLLGTPDLAIPASGNICVRWLEGDGDTPESPGDPAVFQCATIEQMPIENESERSGGSLTQSRFARGVFGYARGFSAVLTVLGGAWLLGGVVGIAWGLVTWNGMRAAGGFVAIVVGSFVVGLNALGPTKKVRRDRWERLRAVDPLRSDLRQPTEPE